MKLSQQKKRMHLESGNSWSVQRQAAQRLQCLVPADSSTEKHWFHLGEAPFSDRQSAAHREADKNHFRFAGAYIRVDI